jgi:hypothetical protein
MAKASVLGKTSSAVYTVAFVIIKSAISLGVSQENNKQLSSKKA